MKMRLVVVGLAFSSLAAAPPPPGPRADDPEGNLIAELVVPARHPGPAWWRVSRGDADVYILGAPDGPLPPGVAWDPGTVEQRLKGAQVMIPPARLQAGVLDLVGMIEIWGLVRARQARTEVLGPDLNARFAADCEKAGKAANCNDGWRPFLAANMLLHDQRSGPGWAPAEREVRRAANANGVPVRTSAVYSLIPFIKTALTNLPPAREAECVAAALDDVEAGPAPYRRAAEGWAHGDVAMAVSGPRSFDRCLLLMAGGPDLWRRTVADQSSDIEQALAKPGHAVAVIPLRRLLAKGGVIETLQARGLEVEGPL
jgi:hypothetical protein